MYIKLVVVERKVVNLYADPWDNVVNRYVLDLY